MYRTSWQHSLRCKSNLNQQLVLSSRPHKPCRQSSRLQDEHQMRRALPDNASAICSVAKPISTEVFQVTRRRFAVQHETGRTVTRRAMPLCQSNVEFTNDSLEINCLLQTSGRNDTYSGPFVQVPLHKKNQELLLCAHRVFSSTSYVDMRSQNLA